MRVELPWPDPKLAPNRRNGHHWTVTNAARANALQSAAVLARVAQIAAGYRAPADGPIPLVLTFCPPDRRARDLDGLLSSCKAALDGVAHALGVNDARFEPLTLRRGDPVKGGRVVLEVGR